jgi:hypothetical protein
MPHKIIEVGTSRELCEGGGKRRGRSGKDGSRPEMGAGSGIRNGTGRQEDSPVPHHNNTSTLKSRFSVHQAPANAEHSSNIIWAAYVQMEASYNGPSRPRSRVPLSLRDFERQTAYLCT